MSLIIIKTVKWTGRACQLIPVFLLLMLRKHKTTLAAIAYLRTSLVFTIHLAANKEYLTTDRIIVNNILPCYEGGTPVSRIHEIWNSLPDHLLDPDVDSEDFRRDLKT